MSSYDDQLMALAARVRDQQSQLQELAVLLWYAGSPDGVLVAMESTFCWDTVNHALYLNTSVTKGSDWCLVACGSDVPSPTGFWTFAGVDDTPTVVIPDGANDVTAVATFIYAVHAVTGGDNAGGSVTLETNDSSILYNDGTDALTLAISAAGAVTLQRTAGADTFNVSLQGVWL